MPGVVAEKISEAKRETEGNWGMQKGQK